MRRAILAASAFAFGVCRAASCIPDVANYTPSPVISYDHDGVSTALYRVYAQLDTDTTWPWHADFPVWPGDSSSDPVFPGVTIPLPLQRTVPTNVQLVNVRVMVKAVSAENVEGPPSNIITVCMPHIWVKPEAYQ